jgi:RimJ/RimL family protein N-acetyltransferase
MPLPTIVLETERLILREMVADDADALARVLSDPVAMRFYPAPFDAAKVAAWIAHWQRHQAEFGHSLWTVVLKASGQVAGDCGLTWQDVQGQRKREIGYHIDPALQGLGLATEAARGVLAWAFRHTDADQVISMMVESNWPSRRVAEKVHAAYLGPCGERAGLPHVHYGTLRVGEP